jgi:hypothetical protein
MFIVVASPQLHPGLRRPRFPAQRWTDFAFLRAKNIPLAAQAAFETVTNYLKSGDTRSCAAEVVH